MSERTAILVIGAQGASLWLRRRVTHYPATAEGHSAMARAAAGLPVRVLLDVMDEEFRREPLLGLRREAITALMARRAARLFPEESRFAFQRMRVAEALLFVLTQPAVLTPWLDALECTGALLAGIHSVPMLGVALARRHATEAGTTLLVFATLHGGLRQLLIDAHGIRLSRLSPLLEEPNAEAVRFEVERFLRFLIETGATAASPAVVCLLPSALQEGLQPYRVITPVAHVGPIFLGYRVAHGRSVPFRQHADEYLVELLREETPAPDYATAAERAPFLSCRRRVAAWRSARVLALSAVLLAAAAAAFDLRWREDTNRFEAATLLMQAQQSRVPEPRAAILSEAELTALERIATSSGALPRALATVGDALQGNPAVTPQKITWNADGRLDLEFTLGAPPRRHQTALEAFLQALRAHPLVEAAQLASEAQDANESGTLDAAALAALQAATRTVTLRLRGEPAVSAGLRSRAPGARAEVAHRP